MSNLSLVLSSTNLTMTTREIAELAGKEHKHVLTDTRNMFESLEIDSAGFTAQYKDSTGRTLPVFLLDKDLTLTLVAGYNVKMRHTIIKRWQELEAHSKELQTYGMIVPKTYGEALVALGNNQILIEQQTKQLELAKPKVTYFDDYVNTDNLKTVTMTGKEMGVSSQKLGKWFRTKGYAFKDKEKGIIWTQPFINKGYGVMKQFSRKDGGYSGTQAYLTPNGEVFVKANYEPVQ